MGPGPHGTGYMMDPAGTGGCVPVPGPVVVPPEPPVGVEEEGEPEGPPPDVEEEDLGPYEPPIEEAEPPDEAGEPPGPEPTPEEEYEEPDQVCTPRLDANGNWIPFVWDERAGTCIPTRPFVPPGAQPPPGPRPPFAPQPVPGMPPPPGMPAPPGARGAAPIIPLMLAAYLLL
jgi:hypothetical protein